MCVCISVYVCMYVSMYVCECICMHACVKVRRFAGSSFHHVSPRDLSHFSGQIHQQALLPTKPLLGIITSIFKDNLVNDISKCFVEYLVEPFYVGFTLEGGECIFSIFVIVTSDF